MSLTSGSRPGPGRLSAWARREDAQLILVLVAALLARLAFLFSHQPGDFYAGGDGPWYVEQAWRIARGELVHPLTPVGPAYPLLLACVWALFPGVPIPSAGSLPPAAFLTTVRLIQIALGILLAWLAYRLARDLTGRHAAGMLAAFGVGLGPAFVLEPMYILTEAVFMTLLALGAWLYVRGQKGPSATRFSLAGAALGLAALTRPVVLLLPVVLIPHLWAVFGRAKARARVTFLLGGFALTILPWSTYLYFATGSPFPEGFGSNLWIGAVGEGKWLGYRFTDEMRQGLGEDGRTYVGEAFRIIGADPLGWLGLRARNLLEALAVPHGTSDLGGPSIKALWGEWLEQDRSLDGLWALANARNFPWKLATYVFHYSAVGLGALALGIAVRRWREFYVVLALIGYLIAVHAVLTILPRYLYPAETFLWVLAGVGASRLLRSRKPTSLSSSGSGLPADHEASERHRPRGQA